MKRFFIWASLTVLILLLISCASRKVMKESYLVPRFPVKKVVVVKSENVRAEANGEIIGKLKKGDSILVLNKCGNWIEFDYYPDEKGYMWAPSLGFSYINLYDPYTYIDTTTYQFISLINLNYILGQVPDTIETVGKLSNLCYKDLGLGKRVEEILNVHILEKQVVEKTVKVCVNTESNKITEIQIDLFNPVTGKAAALKKADMKRKLKEIENSESRIVLALTKGDHPIYFTLKRKEWKSNQFVGYTIAYK